LAGDDLALRPRENEVEISVFGPGYGECVVLHALSGQWIIIDSCKGSNSEQPAALEYLDRLAVDVASQVRLVLATHYHDDHISGIGETFERCKAARFACSMALNTADWTALVAIYRGYLVAGGSGVSEISRVMRELQGRSPPHEVAAPIFCIAGRRLDEPILVPPLQVTCLSPSDAAVATMHTRIREKLLPRAEQRRLAVPNLGSNDGSVVLSIRAGKASALFGADLEERGRSGFGWRAVLDDWPAGADPHDGFKIPHHGSSTGYHPDAWRRLVTPSNGWAVVTPYNRQRIPIPTSGDCGRIAAMTEESFITSHPGWSKFRHPDTSVQKTSEEATLRIGPERIRHGHVRLRKSILSDSGWKVELFGQAGRISSLLAA
jgi:hypothetical protein